MNKFTIAVGFLLAGGGCGGGPRLIDKEEVEPLSVFGFHYDDSVDGVRVMLALTPIGLLLLPGGGGAAWLAGPNRPLPVAFNVGIPPEYTKNNI